MADENLYLKTIHHPDRLEQWQAFNQWLAEEEQRSFERLDDLENDDQSIPDENRESWSYEKGRLDGLRSVHGLVAQAMLTLEAQEVDDHPLAEDDDDVVICHECGQEIDHVDELRNADHPVCPKCGGNPLPPVGGDRLPTDPAPDDSENTDA